MVNLEAITDIRRHDDVWDGIDAQPPGRQERMVAVDELDAGEASLGERRRIGLGLLDFDRDRVPTPRLIGVIRPA